MEFNLEWMRICICFPVSIILGIIFVLIIKCLSFVFVNLYLRLQLRSCNLLKYVCNGFHDGANIIHLFFGNLNFCVIDFSRPNFYVIDFSRPDISK
jgi:hypothetical protein